VKGTAQPVGNLQARVDEDDVLAEFATTGMSSPGRTPSRAPTLLCTALLLAAGNVGLAQPPDAAAVGRDRPLTSTWLCENERSVLLNTHPRRPSEEAWLTYGGTRVAVERVRHTSEVAYVGAGDRVKWIEQGNEAMLTFEGLLDRPIVCRRQEAAKR
jgi:hypothetical protein